MPKRARSSRKTYGPDSKFGYSAGDIVTSQCMFCTHLKPKRTCTAFLGGIPKEIHSNHFDHRQPYPGDNGIQFQALNDSAEQRQFVPFNDEG
jgi:hypothetical protein